MMLCVCVDEGRRHLHYHQVNAACTSLSWWQCSKAYKAMQRQGNKARQAIPSNASRAPQHDFFFAHCGRRCCVSVAPPQLDSHPHSHPNTTIPHKKHPHKLYHTYKNTNPPLSSLKTLIKPQKTLPVPGKKPPPKIKSHSHFTLLSI